MYIILHSLIINMFLTTLKDKFSLLTHFIFPLLVCQFILHNFKHKMIQSNL